MFQLERRQQLAVLVVLAVLVFGGGYRYAVWQNRAAAGDKPSLEQLAPADAAQSPAKEIEAYVVGAVEKPGRYRLPSGARWGDAIDRAVPRPDAALEALNLAAPLPDGQKVVVPTRQEAAAANPAAPGMASGSGGGHAAPSGGSTNGTGPFAAPAAGGGGSARSKSGGPVGMVNINTAGPSELDALPGIGPALAQRIIQYRETKGLFKTPEDIKNVSGIGDKKYEQLKDFIAVN
ncbi:ComEA family DNA-binding protein [Desulfotomaculum copahuensis]|uniref:Competence protein ComEA n=1 Tax=Desulfotomaculum copahuensis TaxID=1838280 RepID=A0A1B7LCJ0_9FIRM|nr:helix-hairpin-helix domain-containing protein [Desulfotomaculum copahuensis]OAT80444.1 competence protein ComEA [Desulfotomaculum copahuensis]